MNSQPRIFRFSRLTDTARFVAIVSLVSSWSVRAQRIVLAVGLFGPWSFAWLVGGVFVGRHTLVFDFDRSADPVGWVRRHLLPDLRGHQRCSDSRGSI